MIQKQTLVNLSDNSGIGLIKTFHLYNGFFRKKSKIGYYSKGSAKLLKKKKNLYLKKNVKKSFKKGSVVKFYLVRQSYSFLKKDSSSIKFKDNSSIIMKKKNVLHSQYVSGPVISDLGKKKIMLSFKKII